MLLETYMILYVQEEAMLESLGYLLKIVDFKPLASNGCRFKSQQGLWILSCEEAIQLAYRSGWFYFMYVPFLSEIMHRRGPEVFLH
jgi:hypothetical protein